MLDPAQAGAGSLDLPPVPLQCTPDISLSPVPELPLSAYSRRFPQTRMGVEQVYIDAFTRAKEYDDAWRNYNDAVKKSSGNKC